MSTAARLLPQTNETNKAVVRSVFRSHHHLDDIVDKQGLVRVLTDLGASSEILARESVVKALMLIMDTNNNGEVDFEEFYRYWCKMSSETDKQRTDEVLTGMCNLYDCYSEYDTSGTAALTQDQFKKLWADMDNDPNLAEEAINFVDQNHDNQITFQELCIAFGLL
jgi:Ca2+-binding EF-hand superfamily protein